MPAKYSNDSVISSSPHTSDDGGARAPALLASRAAARVLVHTVGRLETRPRDIQVFIGLIVRNPRPASALDRLRSTTVAARPPSSRCRFHAGPPTGRCG